MLDVNGKAKAEEMANKILELFKNPFKVKEKNIFTSVSIGKVLFQMMLEINQSFLKIQI